MTIDFSRLNAIQLASGNHASPGQGMCVMEAVAWLTDDDFNDTPACVSEILRGYCIVLNDRLEATSRQRLKTYIPQLIGTAGNARADLRRAFVAADTAARVFAPIALDNAGAHEQAACLRNMQTVTDKQTAEAARAACAACAACSAESPYAAYAVRAARAACSACSSGSARVAAEAWSAVYASEAAMRDDVIDMAFALLDRLITAD